MFIVSKHYGGALKVEEMRGFTNKAEAKKYWDSLHKDSKVWGGTRFVRAYKLSSNKRPMLLNTDKRWENA